MPSSPPSGGWYMHNILLRNDKSVFSSLACTGCSTRFLPSWPTSIFHARLIQTPPTSATETKSCVSIYQSEACRIAVVLSRRPWGINIDHGWTVVFFIQILLSARNSLLEAVERTYGGRREEKKRSNGGGVRVWVVNSGWKLPCIAKEVRRIEKEIKQTWCTGERCRSGIDLESNLEGWGLRKSLRHSVSYQRFGPAEIILVLPQIRNEHINIHISFRTWTTQKHHSLSLWSRPWFHQSFLFLFSGNYLSLLEFYYLTKNLNPGLVQKSWLND